MNPFNKDRCLNSHRIKSLINQRAKYLANSGTLATRNLTVAFSMVHSKQVIHNQALAINLQPVDRKNNSRLAQNLSGKSPASLAQAVTTMPKDNAHTYMTRPRLSPSNLVSLRFLNSLARFSSPPSHTNHTRCPNNKCNHKKSTRAEKATFARTWLKATV